MRTIRNTNSKGKMRKRVAAIAAVFLLAAIVLSPMTAMAENYNEKLHCPHPNWMYYLPETMQISQVNLPGTHDSGTYYMKALVIKGSQTVLDTIPDQLANGIRFFDIRLRLLNDSAGDTTLLKLCHGFTDCYKTKDCKDKLLLNDVLDYAIEFVTKHPSEFVVLELRAEEDKVKTNEILRKFAEEHKPGSTKKKYDKVVCYKYDLKAPMVVPTVGEVRGKVVVLWREGGEKKPGTDYEDHYQWYGKQYITSDKKKSYLTSHLNNYTYDQEYYGESKDLFNGKNAENRSDESYTPGAVTTPLFINTNLTKIFDVLTAVTCMGPYECWHKLYYDSDFKSVSLNRQYGNYPNKRQRTGWWRFDFPQTKQVNDVIESNYVNVKHYQIDLGTEIQNWKGYDPEKIKFTITLDNGKTITKPRSYFSDRGIFDFGYYPATETITSVKIELPAAMETTETYIKSRYFEEVFDGNIKNPLVKEWRRDIFRDGIGGQSEPEPEVPKTGDNTNPTLLAVMMLLSIGAMAVLMRKRRG